MHPSAVFGLSGHTYRPLKKKEEKKDILKVNFTQISAKVRKKGEKKKDLGKFARKKGDFGRRQKKRILF